MRNTSRRKKRTIEYLFSLNSTTGRTNNSCLFSARSTGMPKHRVLHICLHIYVYIYLYIYMHIYLYICLHIYNIIMISF